MPPKLLFIGRVVTSSFRMQMAETNPFGKAGTDVGVYLL